MKKKFSLKCLRTFIIKIIYLFLVAAGIILILHWSLNVKASNNFIQKRSFNKRTKTQIIKTNIDGKGAKLIIDFRTGKTHLNSLFAIWYEDTSGNFIQTLYVSKVIATSIFKYGIKIYEEWQLAVVRKPAALPYWSHQRGIEAEDGFFLPTPKDPVPDGITGATPPGNFILKSRTNSKTPINITVLLEINQAYDWNEYYTIDKYPDDPHYKDSQQPALVYAATINLKSKQKTYNMKPIGHSHYSGQNGKLFKDLSKITTALEIIDSIIIKVK